MEVTNITVKYKHYTDLWIVHEKKRGGKKKHTLLIVLNMTVQYVGGGCGQVRSRGEVLLWSLVVVTTVLIARTDCVVGGSMRRRQNAFRKIFQ